MQMIESRHELGQIELMFLRKALFSKSMLRIQILSVMSCTKRDRREVRVFCPNPLAPRTLVWAASTTVDSPLTLEQTTHPSVRIQVRYSGLLSGPLRGLVRFRRTGTIRVGGTPRRRGTLRRNGTRLLSTITSIGFDFGGQAPGQDGQKAQCRERIRARSGSRGFASTFR